jgi:hypothetical protein
MKKRSVEQAHNFNKTALTLPVTHPSEAVQMVVVLPYSHSIVFYSHSFVFCLSCKA